jgi:hypothetical protein
VYGKKYFSVIPFLNVYFNRQGNKNTLNRAFRGG